MSCDIFVKPQNLKMPNSDLIVKCHDEFGHKYLTLFFIDGNQIFVDKCRDNIVEFIEDLYEDLNEKDGFVIVFHDENQQNYLDVNEDRLFYKTNKTISISKNDCNCLDDVLNIDKDRYSSFFDMFLNDNFYLEITPKSISLYGKYTEKNGYIYSNEIKVEIKTIKISDISAIEDYCNECYICGNKVSCGANFYNVNHVIFLCNKCFNIFNCKKCKQCGLYFTNKYMNGNICLECDKKINFNLSDLFLDNSIGLKYLNLITEPYSKVNFEKENISKEDVKKLLDNKMFYELVKLRKEADNFIRNNDNVAFSREKVRLFNKLMS